MSLAAATRSAAREHPFLIEALRAGIVNYAAAARLLDVDGEQEAVATALRRFAEELPDRTTEARTVRVRMRRGIDAATAETLLSIEDATHPDDQRTAIIATGDVDVAGVATALRRLTVADIPVTAVGVVADRAVLIVPTPDGPQALRIVEETLEAVPT
ncbi:MAG: hypothetical protein SVG88_06385 [Halobacteriales archaeon]|nr:hypothetical protein [Halobacteriales archaeon]